MLLHYGSKQIPSIVGYDLHVLFVACGRFELGLVGRCQLGFFVVNLIWLLSVGLLRHQLGLVAVSWVAILNSKHTPSIPGNVEFQANSKDSKQH